MNLPSTVRNCSWLIYRRSAEVWVREKVEAKTIRVNDVIPPSLIGSNARACSLLRISKEESVSSSTRYDSSAEHGTCLGFTALRIRCLTTMDLRRRFYFQDVHLRSGPRGRCPAPAASSFFFIELQRKRPMPIQVWAVAASIGWTAVVGTMLLYMIFGPN